MLNGLIFDDSTLLYLIEISLFNTCEYKTIQKQTKQILFKFFKALTHYCYSVCFMFLLFD